MKMAELRRMMKSKDKDASDTKDKSSGRKQPVKSKRRGAKGDDDDESVDSHGNIRNLIAEDDDDDEDYTEGDADEEEDSFDTEETDDTTLFRPSTKGLVIAATPASAPNLAPTSVCKLAPVENCVFLCSRIWIII